MPKTRLKSKFRQQLHRIFTSCAVIFFLAAGPAGIAGVQARDTIVAGVPANFPPHYFLKDKKPSGFAIEVMDGIAKRADIKVSYQVFPTWLELHQAMREGTIDIIPNMGITDERLEFADFTRSLESFKLSLFIRKASTGIHNQSDLGGRRVGVVKANEALNILKKRTDIELVLFNSPEEALVGLLTADIDALAFPAPIIMRVAYTAQIDARIKELPPPLGEIKRAIAVGKDRPELLRRLDAAVASFSNSPEYIKIYRKWYGTPTPFWEVKRVMLFMGLVLLLVSVALFIWRYMSIRALNAKLMVLLKRYQLTKDTLLESEKQYRELIENTDNIVTRVDAEAKILFLNPKAEDVFGLPAEKCFGRSIFDFVHPKDREITLRTYVKWQAEKKSMLIFENRQLSKRGEVRTILWTMNFHYDDDGRFKGVNSIGTDLTAIREEEKRLLERDDKIKIALRLTSTGVWSVDLKNRKFMWSDDIFRLLGYAPEKTEPSYEKWLARIHPEDRDSFQEIFNNPGLDKHEFFLEYRTLRSDGSLRWQRLLGWEVYDKNNIPESLYGINTDITEHKLSQKKLAVSESQLRLLLDSTAEGIYGVDLEGKCTLVNRACVALLGYEKKEELLGKNMHALIHHTKKDGSQFPASECRIANHDPNNPGSQADDQIMWRKDGTNFEAEYWSYPIIIDGKPIGTVVTFFDVTRRKENERALREYHDHLEDVVSNRTAELKRIVNLMAGREIRMAELKKQINALKKQLADAGLTPHAA